VEPIRITYLTAGAAGMYCGSCLHDNLLARGMIELGIDVELLPLYTPLQLDQPDVSDRRVFFGGINVYLQQRYPIFRRLPRWIDRLLDNRRLLRWIGNRGIRTEAQWLGEMTLSMLRGTDGAQHKEVDRLCHWLQKSPRPDLLHLSNLLIAGSAPELKRRLDVPIVATLQGDDLFLDQLPDRYRQAALLEMKRLSAKIDRFLVHSDFYADRMARLLSISPRKIRKVPLGVDTTVPGDDQDQPKGSSRTVERPTDGDQTKRVLYMARLAPEKGLHILVDAFITLRQMPQAEATHLWIAGWLGVEHRAYAEEQFEKLRQAGLESSFRFWDAIDGRQKAELLSGADLLCVPPTYDEPKGLYVLEALAAGVPVVVSSVGALPELLDQLGGGRLVRPNDSRQLAGVLHDLLTDDADRQELARRGRKAVRSERNSRQIASATLAVLKDLLDTRAVDLDRPTD